MKSNIGIADKIIRIILGLAAYGLFVLGVTSGWVALTTVAVGTVFLLTAFVNICPLYKLIGMKTCSYNGC
jgi:hypothetical protein